MRPIITLTSDFGLSDAYVAQMKAALLRGCPDATLVDVTHQIARHDILAGSLAVERMVAAFGEGAVHLAVVDPGVGTDRPLLAIRSRDQWIVCPDNGLATWSIRRWGGQPYRIVWRPPRASDVFHGRDILAPVAAVLARGGSIGDLAEPVPDIAMLDIAPAREGATSGRVIHIDHFGNCTTNLLAERLPPTVRMVQAGQRAIGRIRTTYADVAPGEPVALIGSSALLEVAINQGSAAAVLSIKVGSRVDLRLS